MGRTILKNQNQWKLNSSLPPLPGKPGLEEPKPCAHSHAGLNFDAFDMPCEMDPPDTC